jgi:hypothetical protein
MGHEINEIRVLENFFVKVLEVWYEFAYWSLPTQESFFNQDAKS